MTDWDAIRATAEPDTLAKVIADIEGALLPMMKAMPKEPDEQQWNLLTSETNAIFQRVHEMWYSKLFHEEVTHGDDANTDP